MVTCFKILFSGFKVVPITVLGSFPQDLYNAVLLPFPSGAISNVLLLFLSRCKHTFLFPFFQ